MNLSYIATSKSICGRRTKPDWYANYRIQGSLIYLWWMEWFLYDTLRIISYRNKNDNINQPTIRLTDM